MVAMKALVVALALLVLAPDALAGGFVWERQRVRVWDYTSPLYDGVVTATVRDFNAIMPKRGPRLVYRRMPQRPCAAVKRKHRGITLCNVAPGADGEFTDYRQARHATRRTVVKFINDADVLDGSPDPVRWSVEHEMTHAVFGAPERVANSDITPGSPLHRFAQRLYRQHGR
jgi:hypothetical protein